MGGFGIGEAANLAAAGAGMAIEATSNRRGYKWGSKMAWDDQGRAKDMARFNYDQQMKMWEATGPKGQMEQLKAAGLNPGLIYGMGGAGGQTTAAAEGQSGKATMSRDNIGMNIANMGSQAIAQMQLLKAQKENIEASTEKTKAETTKTAGVDTQEGYARIGNLGAMTENAEAKTKLTEIESRIAEIDADIKEHSFNDVVNTILWESRKIEREVELLNNQKKISDATVQTAIKQIRANLGVTLATKAAIEAGTTLTEAQTRSTITRIQQDWEDLRIKAGGLSEQERKGAWDRYINDMQESFKITADAGAKILQALGLKELLKGGHTPIQGFQRR